MEQPRWREYDEDSDGDTPLHFAAAAGNYHQLFNYLSFGCNPNSQNNLGWTPLMQAARKGHTHCVKLLLNSGADVAVKNRFAASGSLETVSLIVKENIQRGVSVAEIEKYFSPVFFAVIYNQIDILRYLEKYKYSLTKTVPLGDFSPVVITKILKYKEIRGFFKRRGIMAVNYQSPLLNLEENMVFRNTPSSQKTMSDFSPDIPILLLHSPAIPCTPFNTPDIQFLDPSFMQVRKRKSSNLILSPVSVTPDLSPIVSTGRLSRNSQSSLSAVSINSSNHSLNSRIKLKFSSTDESNDSGAFFYPAGNGKNSKRRSASCTATEAALDDVFLSIPVNCTDGKEFNELLRKNSLDSCIHLFKKHEIDLDLFLTLSKSDLEEIGVDWDKRDDVLEVIYQCNKKRSKNV